MVFPAKPKTDSAFLGLVGIGYKCVHFWGQHSYQFELESVNVEVSSLRFSKIARPLHGIYAAMMSCIGDALPVASQERMKYNRPGIWELNILSKSLIPLEILARL